MAAFRSGAATGPPAGARLRVTTVRQGSGVFLTDRGPRRLPAWLFGFAGVHGPAAVLAVASEQIFSPPIPAGRRPPLVDWAHGSGNVVCLTLGYPRQVTTMLPLPLGARVIVDAVSRTAVAATASHPAG